MEIEAYRSYIIRVPRFTIETLSILNYQSRMDLIQNMLKDEIFESSIKYSSPILFDEVFVRQKDTSVDDKLFLTLLAYNIRMSTRATPFGYLAGLGAGTIGENDKVIINSHNFHINSQPKFEALESRAQLLENDKKIRKYLKWCSNSSLYTINDEIRYYEIKNSNRKTSFYLTSLGSSKYIEEVIELADKGSTFDNLVDYLVSNDILEGSAESFINELIDSQILISEIKPTICGKSPEFFFHNKVNTLQNRVLNINNDKSNYINPNNEQDIKTIIKSNKISISKQTLTKIKETFLALNKIPVNHQSFHFKEFIRSFKKRYGTQQVDLCEALDLSYGVGYPINPNYEDDFIRNNLVISDIQKKSKVLNWSEFVASLNQELQSKNNIKNNTLYLQNSFFDQFENADKFSSSFSILVELYKFNEETKIYFDAALGNSATKLFSKYSNTQKEIGSLVQEICEVEHKQNTNAILAEIIHLPSSGVSEIVQT